MSQYAIPNRLPAVKDVLSVAARCFTLFKLGDAVTCLCESIRGQWVTLGPVKEVQITPNHKVLEVTNGLSLTFVSSNYDGP